MKRILTAIGLMISCLLGTTLYAKGTQGVSVWMPDVVSGSGHEIDFLYLVILWIVIIIFLITEGLLLYSVIAFRAKPGRRAQYFHGSTAIEVVLAGIPTLILIYITFASGRLWSDLKLTNPKAADSVHVQVFGQQFAWNFRYAGPDAAFGTADDIMTINEAVLPVGKDVVFHFSAKDVIHSFFLPESRLKQDTVPGLLTKAWTHWDVLPVWDIQAKKRVLLSPADYDKAAIATAGYEFVTKPAAQKKWYQASSSETIQYYDYDYQLKKDETVVVMQGGKAVKAAPQYVRHQFEIGCAQLCGNGHYGMRGTVRVISQGEFDAWLKAQTPDAYMAGTWNGLWDKFHPEFNRVL